MSKLERGWHKLRACPSLGILRLLYTFGYYMKRNLMVLICCGVRNAKKWSKEGA